jgi:hypothetical protein
MDRRVGGALLLAIVMIVAVVLPNLHPKAIAGRAGMAAVPPVPYVGECLLQPPPDPSVVSPGQSFRLGRCSGTHYGEVAEVVLIGAAHADRMGGRLPENKPCSDETGYLGWSPTVPALPGVQWRPIDVPVFDLSPSDLQRAFGQNWVVCLVTPSTPGASYSGSIRNAMATGRLPDAFAECLTTISALLPATSCSTPHRFEAFGFAELPLAYRDQAGLDATCRAIVKSSTRMADATAGGALTIRAAPFHWDPAGDPAAGFPNHPADQAAEAVCVAGVTGSRLLAGTLFGIDARPLPWA